MFKNKISVKFGLLALAFASIFIAFLQVGYISATAECFDQTQVSFDSVLSLDKNKYEVYVKLNRAGQSDNATVLAQDIDVTTCQDVGNVTANDTSWSKAGVLSVESDEKLLELTLQLKDQQVSQDASSPMLLLVPQIGSPCTDPNKCAIEYNGQKFLLQPKKISLTADTLRVAQYLPFNPETKVKEVVYSVDNRPVYSTPKLGAFNLKYVSPGRHTLTTTVVLADGQALKSELLFDQSFGVLTYLWPKIYGQSGVGSIIFLITGFLFVLLLLLKLLRFMYKKRRWRQSHILSANKSGMTLNDATKQKKLKIIEIVDNTNLLLKIIGIGMGLLLLIFIVSQYVIGVFTVDGPSMETTLHDKSKHPLFTLPVTIGKINGHAYVPKRGEIVVFRKDENNLFDVSAEKHDSYVVKRVLALPGERVIVKEGRITVINKENPTGFDSDKNVEWASVIALSEGRLIDITLKDGEVFISGDNRDESIDSRYYGPIQASQIIGKVL